jgi:DNA-binding transcriptional ArsR family regulator
MDEVFKALADASRRRLLDSLNARNGQSLRELCAGLDMARQSVSKHLAVLEAANLVTTVWRGREKLHHLNAEPINAIADRWINRYDRDRVRALADLKTALESKPMSGYRRLSFTDGEIPPEHAEALGWSEEEYAEEQRNRDSRMTFVIEPVGDAVKLTLVHGPFPEGGKSIEVYRESWPEVLSSLKSLLETGDVLAVAAE